MHFLKQISIFANDMAGIYIHIPFCKSRCIYCGFYSSTKISMQDDYVEALCREMELRHTDIQDVHTIYLGGGTPSQLSESNLQKIFHHLYSIYTPQADEITIECNPDDVTPTFAKLLTTLGINRVSMGVQSFSDKRLQFLRRRHTAEQALKAIDCLHDAEIDNISIDLIFAYPNETLEEALLDIKTAAQVDVTHISAYNLMYEEGTILNEWLLQHKIKEVDEEMALTIYNHIIEILREHGFEHYEISNFAKPGYRSKHNSSYWQDIPYLGLGASACSYDLLTRKQNVADISQYIDGIRKNTLPLEIEQVTPISHYNDIVMTALRTCEGIDLSKIVQHFGENISGYLLQQATPYINRRLLELTGNHLRLTKEGIFVSDGITAELMQIDEQGY